MRVVVTGAAGLIGRHTVRYLSDRGVAVIGVGRDPVVDLASQEWITCDLAQTPSRLDLRTTRADAVVHLAAIPSPGVLADDALFANNSVATSNVLHAAAEAGIRRAVVASSISIYGYVWSGEARPDLDRVPLSEHAPIRPSDGYALTKEADEAIARMHARRHGMSIACLRFPNVSTVEDAMERRRAVTADPAIAHRELWAYLTLDDAAEVIRLALLADFEGAVIANAVSSQSLYMGDVRELVHAFYPEAEDGLPPGNEQGAYDIDIARAVFGFEPARSLVPLERPITN